MEQLATGLNKAAQAMQTGEAEAEAGAPGVPSEVEIGNLEDRQLFQLLEEAYDYRGGTKDRNGKSEMFRVSHGSQLSEWELHFKNLANNLNQIPFVDLSFDLMQFDSMFVLNMGSAAD